MIWSNALYNASMADFVYCKVMLRLGYDKLLRTGQSIYILVARVALSTISNPEYKQADD